MNFLIRGWIVLFRVQSILGSAKETSIIASPSSFHISSSVQLNFFELHNITLWHTQHQSCSDAYAVGADYATLGMAESSSQSEMQDAASGIGSLGGLVVSWLRLDNFKRIIMVGISQGNAPKCCSHTQVTVDKYLQIPPCTFPRKLVATHRANRTTASSQPSG